MSFQNRKSKHGNLIEWLNYDYVLMYGVLYAMTPETNFFPFAGVLSPVLWVLVESLLVATIGTTPGKLLFGIRVVDESGDIPRLSKSIVRSINIVLRGLFVLIPLMSAFAMRQPNVNPNSDDRSSWDVRAGTDLEFKHIGIIRYGALVAIAIALFVYWYA